MNENVTNEHSAYEPDLSKKVENVSLDTMWIAVIEFGRDISKTAILINSGAVIAILAFMGTIASNNQINEYWLNVCSVLPKAMAGYILGLILACISSAFAYFSQIQFLHSQNRKNILRTTYNFYEPLKDDIYKNHDKKGSEYRRLSIGFLIASFVFFVISSINIFWAF